MAGAVTVKDHGYHKGLVSLIKADNMNVRVGYQSGVPKYPGPGKVPLSKVAGIFDLGLLFGETFDSAHPEIMQRLDRAQSRMLQGEPAERVLWEELGQWLRDRYRGVIVGLQLVKTGRLHEGVRATVYDGKTPVFGDDPKGPRAKDAVSLP